MQKKIDEEQVYLNWSALFLQPIVNCLRPGEKKRGR